MEKDRNGQEHEDYVLLVKGAEAELVEKKSRFIATVRPVASEEEAAAFIEEMKKKYYDARHNCSAFVIGSRAQITRSSDDGEPSGTAGRPMLEVLLGSGIRNIAAVVTRYAGQDRLQRSGEDPVSPCGQKYQYRGQCLRGGCRNDGHSTD